MSRALRKHKDKASTLAAKGKLNKALIEYRKAIHLAPNEIALRQKAAEILRRLGRIDEAIREYQAVAGRYALDGLLLKAIAISKVILQMDPKHFFNDTATTEIYTKQQGSGLVTLMPSSMVGAISADASLKARKRKSAEAPPLPDQGAGESIELNTLEHVEIDLDLDESVDILESRDEGEEEEESIQLDDHTYLEIQISDGLPAVPLFSDLSKGAFQSVVKVLDMRIEGAEKTLIREGSRGHSMFVLVQGSVRVERELDDGTHKTVARMRAGSFFGEMALMSDSPRLASVITEEECIVLELTRGNLNQIIKKHPSISRVLERFYRTRLLANVLRANPIFRSLPAADKQELIGHFKARSLPRHQVILEQGQKGDGLYLILRGKCEAFQTQPGQKRVRFPDMREGDFFGEISLLKEIPVTATVRAKTACVVMRLHRRAFKDFLKRHAALAKTISEVGEKRLKREGKALENPVI
jgi:CRP-like cAMP-binding protein